MNSDSDLFIAKESSPNQNIKERTVDVVAYDCLQKCLRESQHLSFEYDEIAVESGKIVELLASSFKKHNCYEYFQF